MTTKPWSAELPAIVETSYFPVSSGGPRYYSEFSDLKRT